MLDHIIWSEMNVPEPVCVESARSKVTTDLTHHQSAVLGAVSVRVAVAVAVASHHAERLIGALTCCWPEREKPTF